MKIYVFVEKILAFFYGYKNAIRPKDSCCQASILFPVTFFLRKVTCDEWRCFVLRSTFVLCLILGAERGAILEKYLEQGDPSPPSPFWYDRK